MVFASIKEALVKRHVIELRGFGTFEIKIRGGRQKARNPKTGEVVSVNSHGTACFRPGRDLKSAVWKLSVEETGDAKNGVILDGADNSGAIENSIGGGT
jgi:integration host factor subunit beta